MTTRFDLDTAVRPLGGGRFAARMDRGWWIERGPNGGYVAAVLVRALEAHVGDPGRTPRSLTVHYLAPPREGDAEVACTVERSGRQLTYATARLWQGERLLALAMAAFAVPMDPGFGFSDLRMPVVPPPHECELLGSPPGFTIPMRERYESRWAVEARPFTGSPAVGEAVSGGWIRFAEPGALDHAAIAAIADAWIPAVFSRMGERLGVPTIDLTVHFRTRLPHATMAPDDFCLALFHTRMVADGLLEEDGEIWSPDGVLLAHSRQLGMLLAVGR